MNVMSRRFFAMSLLLLPACGASEVATLAEFWGTWAIMALDERGDSIAASTLVAGTDPSAWRVTFPGREPIAVHVLSAAGDSVVLRSDPYESVLEPDVQVTTDNVLKVRGDQITGTWLSRRTVMGPDSILRGTIRGQRER